MLFVATVIGILYANASNGRGFSPCTPVTTGCTAPFGTACPDTLPDATVGTFYQEVVTIYMPASVDTTLPLVGTVNVPVDTVRFVGVSGLPDGLDFYIDVLEYYPEPGDTASQYTCLYIYGTPCGGNQTINATIDLDFAVTSPFGAATLTQNFPVTFNLTSTVPVLEISSTLDFLCTTGSAGTDATLTAPLGFSTYQWSTAETSESITVNAAGSYTLSVTDALGCSQEASYEIEELAASVAGNTFTICPNQILPLQATGGSSFTWAPAANISDPNVANPVVYDLTSDETFTVTVSNGFCSDDATVSVTVSSLCEGDCAQGTPDRSCTPGAGEIATLCPGTLPAMTSGTVYDAEVSFFFPASVPLETIVELAVGIALPGLPQVDVSPDFVVVSDVVNLPDGLNWSCDQLDVAGNNCTYYPALEPSITQYGAITFCGTPCGSTTTDTVRVVFTATATLPAEVPILGGQAQSFDLEVPALFTITNSNPLTVAASQTGILPVGTPVTLTAAAGFTNYTWNNGATTAEITVNVGGTYTVSAFDGTCTQTANILVEYATGIENINAATLNIFPNPNNGNFEVSFDLKKATDVTVSIFNTQGKEVYAETFAANAGNNNKNVSLKNLSSGIYIVKMNVDGGSISRRVTLF